MTTNSLRKTAVTPRATMFVMAGLIVVLLGGILLLNTLVGQNGAAQYGPPLDFQFLAEIDLSIKTWEEAAVAQFSLAESAEVGLYFNLRSVDSASFDLSLQGPNSFQTLILHSETYRTDEAGAGWQRNFTLPPGDYRVMLTAVQSPGVLSIYWGTAE